jgi:glutathione S-transferase
MKAGLSFLLFLLLLLLLLLLLISWKVSIHQTTSLTSWRVGLGVIFFSGFALLVSYFQLSVIIVISLLPIVALCTFSLIRVVLGGLLSTMKRRKSDTSMKRYRLVAMPISHFSEKARWCMDLIGAPYDEMNVGGILSLFFRSRTVPWLVDFQSNSVIGNSDEILMYLSAVYVPTLSGTQKNQAQQLFFRNEETMSWEDDFNKFGHAIQGWAYHYLLDPKVSSEYTLRAWGAFDSKVSILERVFLRWTHPFFRQFLTVGLALQDPLALASREKTILSLFDRVDQHFEMNPSSLYLVADHLSYVDVVFCSLAAPLLFFTLICPSPSQVNQRSFYAKNRFSSCVITSQADYHELQRGYPKELVEFEKNLLARPSGRYIVRMYQELRWKVFK